MREVKIPEHLNDFIGGVIFHKKVKGIIDGMEMDELLVVDLDNLQVDSSIIGTLLAIRTSCQKKGIGFYIDNVCAQTKRIIEATGLSNLLIDYKDRPEGED